MNFFTRHFIIESNTFNKARCVTHITKSNVFIVQTDGFLCQVIDKNNEKVYSVQVCKVFASYCLVWGFDRFRLNTF